MPRSQKIEIGVVNVVTQPHSPSNYAKLWLLAANLQRAVKVLGDTYAVIRTAFLIDRDNPDKGIYGDIIRFTHIDMDRDWFDMEKGEVAPSEEVEMLVSIPETLKPNSSRLRYVFFPECHRMVFTTKFEGGSLSPLMTKTLLKRVFSDERLSSLAPLLEVTPEQSREQLEQIFGHLALKRLQITVKVPNSDDDGGFAETLGESLKEERARKLIEIRIAEPDESLNPNDRTKQLARVAMSNGSVEGDGYDENGDKQTFDTEEHPIRIPEFVPNEVAFSTWFIDKAREILRDLLM